MTLNINILNHKNYSIGYVHRIMKMVNIKARIRRRHSNYIKAKPEQVGENILNRDFNATHPNQKWLTDVTEFKISNVKEKLYLSAIIDLFDNSIVAYELSNHNNNELVFKTFDKAIKNNPYATPMLHSDRGFQYTSKIFKIKLDQHNIIQSMSRVGKCIDNGPMEAFWGTLKSEMFYGVEFSDLESLKEKIELYIFNYNNWRLQTKTGTTPNQLRYHTALRFVV